MAEFVRPSIIILAAQDRAIPFMGFASTAVRIRSPSFPLSVQAADLPAEPPRFRVPRRLRGRDA
jgi:hypothetical protein